jgi:hypothetical protein
LWLLLGVGDDWSADNFAQIIGPVDGEMDQTAGQSSS